MTSLDEYLRGQYIADRAFLGRLSDTIQETAPIFHQRLVQLPLKTGGQDKNWTWLYGVGQPERKLDHVSASTHCMILFALESMLNGATGSPSLLLGRSYRPTKLSKGDSKALATAARDAKATLLALVDWRAQFDRALVSSTYGKDDPFTLTWMAEILFRLAAPGGTTHEQELASHRTAMAAVIDSALDRTAVLDTKDQGEFREVRSAFLDLRRIHLAKTVDNLGKGIAVGQKWMSDKGPDLWEKFDIEIHRHLSYAAMDDSRFDPSELAFALEGALLLHPNWVSPSTVDTVFDALRLSKERQPYWRPVTPLLANTRGHVLFLISIEVANSILRSCEILDGTDARLRRFSQIEPQLRTYTTWLLGELEEAADGGVKSVGWRSEYEDKSDRGKIFLWYTSHVLIFLTHYHSLLKGKIGSDGASAAGLDRRTPRDTPNYWSDEPVSDLGERYSVLATINEEYIRLRADPNTAKDAPSSMLLFGPPGTGKTTVAEKMAFDLKRPLIVVTVSDFLAAGAAEIENRAKGVFTVLRAQDDVVILFDEIDQFLLDRNSELYQGQDDVFKFMTPGMLTKLQDLRDAENCIFIIATNYYERIDSAIKRTGRIDKHFLLSLPDKTRRVSFLVGFIVDRLERRGDTAFRTELTAALNASGVINATALFGWGDLKNLAKVRADIDKTLSPAAIAKRLETAARDMDPSTSLSAYHARFNGQSQFPFEEFFLVTHLVLQSRSIGPNEEEPTEVLSDSDKEAMDAAFQRVPRLDGVESFGVLNTKGYVADQSLFGALERHKEVLMRGWSKKSS